MYDYYRKRHVSRESKIIDGNIAETFFGEFIDLSKIISISKAKFIDKMGRGGYYVGFEIKCQLQKEPITYTREFESDEKEFKNGKYNVIYNESGREILAVERLQKEIYGLIKVWIESEKVVNIKWNSNFKQEKENGLWQQNLKKLKGIQIFHMHVYKNIST